MANKPKITKEIVAEYIRQNPDSALSYDLLPLAARAGNQYLYGAGNRIGANIAAIPALFSSKRDFGKERDFNKEVLQAVSDYQAQETPLAAAGADALGVIGSNLVTGAAFPKSAWLGGGINPASNLPQRVLRTAKGAITDQTIRSLLGDKGVYEKTIAGVPLSKSLPQAMEQIGTAAALAPLFGEAFRGAGKGTQYLAEKTKLNTGLKKLADTVTYKGENKVLKGITAPVADSLNYLSKNLTSESSALKQSGFTPDDVEAARLVSGTANIPDAPKGFTSDVQTALKEGAEAAQQRLDKAANAGVKLSSGEAYAPQSNIMQNLQKKAGYSPVYQSGMGEIQQVRPQEMRAAAENLRPQLLKAKDELYAAPTVVDKTGILAPTRTIGDLNAQKKLAYDKGDTVEAERIKALLRSSPEGAKAEELYGAAKDIRPLVKAGGGNLRTPTTPYSGKVDVETVLGKAKNLKETADTLLPANQRPSKEIPFTTDKAKELPTVQLAAYGNFTRGKVPLLTHLQDALFGNREKYFNKLAPSLLGQKLPTLVKAVEQYSPYFTRQTIAPIMAKGVVNSQQQDLNTRAPVPSIPQTTDATPDEIKKIMEAPAQTLPNLGGDATPEEIRAMMGIKPQPTPPTQAFPAPEGYINLPQYQEILRNQ